MNKNYVKPILEIIYFEKEISMINNSIVIDYPWGNEENEYFENE